MPIFILKIQIDGSVETYYCDNMQTIKDFLFNIFTDFDINEDTIDDIDSHLRERSEGFVTVEKVFLNRNSKKNKDINHEHR